jgi:exodeoxyribonuclease V gamma subunit
MKNHRGGRNAEATLVAHPFCTVGGVTFHLTVAASPTALVDALATVLSDVPADPFTTEVMAVPGDGVRSWITSELADRLGVTPDRHATPDGVVANIDFVFPAGLVRRALGQQQPGTAWNVGQLTWAVYEVLHEHGDAIGRRGDALQCRSIADLFDRYALHRTSMVRAWERGADVDPAGRELPAQLRWQPRLWRALLERLGSPSGAADMAMAANELRLGRRRPDLPDRVFLVGLASLPAPHLDVLTALAQAVDVHVFAPTPSLAVWRRVHDTARALGQVTVPVARIDDPTVPAARHPLGITWGRTAREAQFTLALAAVDAGGVVAQVDEATADVPHQSTVLGRLQHDLRADLLPPGPPAVGVADERPTIDPDDQSLGWHRCHGASRQAEVVRDVVLRLLEERNPDGTSFVEPRDIAILCPDLATFAPLLEAAFAGDRHHGIPPIPLRVADRSLRQDSPLLDAVGALVELLDGRFRASDVLSFAALAPVRRRFGITFEQLGRMTSWVENTNIRWGLDPDGHERFGVPGGLGVHTWQAGVDQLLVGATMADPLLSDGEDATAGFAPLGPGDTVPFPDVEGDDVVILGAFADVLHELGRTVAALSDPLPVGEWCQAVAAAADALFDVPDAESWQWRTLHRVLTDLENEACVGELPCQLPVPAVELSALLVSRLGSQPGRATFGSGAVTASSLTAQRGVPHRVICLLGLDGDLGAGGARADDLTATVACVGDRDARSELRAQLLDAVLAAQQRLVICSTGHDLRTNADVPPTVALAELVDVIDATFAPSSPSTSRASEELAIDHPRHAWSQLNFRPGAFGPRMSGPWSFDRGALEAARVRVHQDRHHRRVHRSAARRRRTAAHARWARTHSAQPRPDPVCRSPRRLAHRCRRSGRRSRAARHHRPACLAAPARPAHCSARSGRPVDHRARRALGARPTARRQRAAARAGRRGAGRSIRRGRTDAARVRAAVRRRRAPTSRIDSVEVSLGEQLVLSGEVSGVRGRFVVEVTASRIKPVNHLLAWCRLAALTRARPETPWESVVVGCGSTSGATVKVEVVQLRLRSPEAAAESLALIADLHLRALRTVVPALPATTWAVFEKGLDAIEEGWGNASRRGDGHDRWVRFALGAVDAADLAAQPPLPDESGAGWPDAPSRIERWAARLWGAFTDSVEVEVVEVVEPADIGVSDG